MNVVKILISTAGGGGDAHRRLDPVLRASTQQALSSVVTCIHAYRSFCPSPAEHRRAENTSACHRPYVSDPHRAPQPPPLAPLPAQDYSAPARPSFLDSRPASQWDTPDATDSASPRPRPAHRPELIVCTVKVRSIVVPVQQRVLRLHPAVLSCAMRCLVRLPSTRKACRPAHGTETASNASSQQLLRGGLDLDGYSAAARQRGFETAMDRYARPRTTRHGGRKKEQLVGARELRILFETVCARLGTEQTF